MKKSAELRVPARPHGGAEQPCGGTQRVRWAAVLSATRRAYLQVFGIPDYERYRAHMTNDHPGEPVLSRREFCARAIDRKYGRNVPRCC